MAREYEYGLPGISFAPVDFRKKKQRIIFYTKYILNKCQEMLVFDNLPDTVPERDLRRLLQLSGYAIGLDPAVTEGKPYFFYGGLGGEPDAYYNPTIATISSPSLKFSGTYRIHEQAVVVRHDAWEQGLLPLILPYATMAAETDLSLRMALINARIPSLISANDDRTYTSAKEYLKQLEAGEIGCIFETKLLEALKVQPYANTAASQTFTDLIEVTQYLKASLWNDLGINANYNMKREAIGKGESTLDKDAIIPFADNMLLCRQEDLKRVNDLYGTDISIQFSSAWLENLIETESTLIALTQPTNPFQGGGDEQMGANETDMGQSGPDIGQSGPDVDENETESEVNENEESSEQGAESADSSEREDESEQSEGGEESEESEINDTASEGILEEIEEKIIDKLDEPEVVALTQQEGDENATEGEASDSEEDISDN